MEIGLNLKGRELSNQTAAPSPQKENSSRFGRLLQIRDKLKGKVGRGKEEKTEIVFSKEEEAAAIGELGENVKLFKRVVGGMERIGRHIKENPMEVAAILVPTALGALGMIDALPVPADVLARASLASGGAFIGASRAEGQNKLTAAIVGAAAGAMVSEGTHHMPMGKAAEMAANYLDDIPTVGAVVTPAVKKVGVLGKR